MEKMERTHDKAIYLKEDRHQQPKELFKVLFGQLENLAVLREGVVVCDFGCATGEFLYFLRGKFPGADYRGIDLVPELIEKARRAVPGVMFRVGSVLDQSLWPTAAIDITLSVGVLPIFDDFEPCLTNLLSWTKPGGVILVASLFNPYPVDVWVKYKLSDDPDRGHREPGWNLPSKTSVSRFLNQAVGQERYAFVPFEMPFDLPPRPDDPIRTWTFQSNNGQRFFTNGLSLILNQEILVIKR